ncbi:hypothetical protein BDZ85DRAFT_261229 [Elsinoe ampelina]|uniref:Uncharacterized protein n=1 Tax=Elsinoe ampelina TaxID=302913 RepID=A0A6A6GG42_9PEZI|nr:hypothetical protein BDZ85DRAFT_261229 [Elsinoe ampelina]
MQFKRLVPSNTSLLASSISQAHWKSGSDVPAQRRHSLLSCTAGTGKRLHGNSRRWLFEGALMVARAVVTRRLDPDKYRT